MAKKKLSEPAKAGYEAFRFVWREAQRWDYDTFVDAWNACAAAAIAEWESDGYDNDTGAD